MYKLMIICLLLGGLTSLYAVQEYTLSGWVDLMEETAGSTPISVDLRTSIEMDLSGIASPNFEAFRSDPAKIRGHFIATESGDLVFKALEILYEESESPSPIGLPEIEPVPTPDLR
ncbi:MAG: hypothetical protein ACI9BD_001574 [Candidatus Marinamargulisbacteria bacterium]|jgi:hypothetical protein